MREDAGIGLIHPEAVKARLGELNARSLAEARSVVEVALTEFAATRATDDDLARIRAAMVAMRETRGRPAGLHPGRLRVPPRHRRCGS